MIHFYLIPVEGDPDKGWVHINIQPVVTDHIVHETCHGNMGQPVRVYCFQDKKFSVHSGFLQVHFQIFHSKYLHNVISAVILL